MLGTSSTKLHPIIGNHKVLMLGDKELESSFLHNYMEIHLDQQYLRTLGIDFGVVHFRFLGEKHKFHFYQLSPDPKFAYLLEKFMPGSKAIILPFVQLDENLAKQIDSIMKLVDQMPELESLKIILLQEDNKQEGKVMDDVHDLTKHIQKEYDDKVTMFQNDPHFTNSLELALHFILNDFNKN